MFDIRPCMVHGCPGSALTGLSVCSRHCDDLTSYSRRISETLRREKKLVDHDISGIMLQDLDANGVQISGCNMRGTAFYRVSMRGAVLHLVFCDHAELRACDFSASMIRNTVFADSLVEDSLFEDCELLQCNFMGVRAKNVTFDHSNLYASRFLGCVFDRVGMNDCNLTRARFDRNARDIDFRSSNVNEARFVEPIK
jgi:uncharacterized protein YjbI with pentapeptide repeats